MEKYKSGIYVAGFLTNHKMVNSARIDKLREEFRVMMKNYNLSRDVLSSFKNYECYSQAFKEDNLIKIGNLIHEILISYGYSEEEVTNFMVSNKAVFNSDYVDFRYRLALMYKYGLLDEVFFHHPDVLTRHFTRYHYGTRTLYSVLLRNEIEGIGINEKNLTSISKSDLVDIKEKYPFDMEKLKEYDNEMIKYLRIKKAKTLVKKRNITTFID